MRKLIGILLIAFLGANFYSCKSQIKGSKVLIHTEYGDIKVVLYDETPKHRDNFLKLVKEGYYDSLLFHRVIQDFMIQGGDPDSKNAPAGTLLGNGGPKETIPAEFNEKLFHKKGALAAAREGDEKNPTKASSGSQFYIVQGKKFTEDILKTDQQKLYQYIAQLFQKPEYASTRDTVYSLQMTGQYDRLNEEVLKLKPIVEKEFGVNLTKEISPEKLKAYTTIGGAPHLDGGYTVFGEVIEGLDVIDKIAALQTDGNARPMKDVRMSIKVIK